MQDLSSLADGINFGASMAGGNVISDVPRLHGGDGSPSEQTSDLPYDPQHNDPELQLGDREDYANFQHSGHDDAFADYTWETVEGIG